MKQQENQNMCEVREEEIKKEEVREFSENEVEDNKGKLLSKKRYRGHFVEGSRSIDNYDYLNKIDEGSYGVVFRGKDKETKTVVAIKKVKLHNEKEGFPITSIREINILLNFEHENIVKVKEVVIGSSIDKIYMVMEYMDHEVKALLSDKKYVFNLSQIKCLAWQLLKGVEYMHNNWVFHRDLKTSNLLYNNKGMLKIADFGLARKFGDPLKPYTQLVVTLWYRAPELLLGCEKYGSSIDMWSVGCIIAEFFLREPLFQGQEEIDQLNKIFRVLGTPSEETWPGWLKLPGAKKVNFKKFMGNKLKEKFATTEGSSDNSSCLSDYGVDLIKRLLVYDPVKRISASKALTHPWFKEDPKPCNLTDMPDFPELNDKERELLKQNVKKSLDEVQKMQRENIYADEERGNKVLEYLDKE